VRRRIEETFARIASRSYQHRFISEATREEYVLPGEMLDSAASLVDNTLRSKVLSQSLSDSERQCLEMALHEFRRLLEGNPFDDPEFSTENDQRWITVRKVANRCLHVLEFDLERWETENGLGGAP
jgi:hypothetical protein